MDTKTVLRFAVDQQVRFVDLRFTDLLGQWHHMTFPINQLSEDSFIEGFGFDASSLRGWAAINESDMLLIPDSRRFWLDPFFEEPTLCLIADIYDPLTKKVYNLDPRSVARRAANYLQQTDIADTAFFGPEAEFFVFDNVCYHNQPHNSYYAIDSGEGAWTSGRDTDNLGYRVRPKEGYVPVPPVDSLQNIRSEIALNLLSLGIEVECHHHEVASGGQCEIDFRFSDLLTTADNLMLFKYVVRNTCHLYGKAATFMPKPLYGDNGSGMHCHQSLWKNGKPLFAGKEYAGLSEMALYYIGGLIKHAPALAAFVAPSTNSYKRLVPGYEAPVNLAYSARNRSAANRIPVISNNPKSKRIEFRPPDGSCNPYLAFAAMTLAGLDGIKQQIHPGDPLDKDIYGLNNSELQAIPSLPSSLEEALVALEQDQDFLLQGDVFSKELITRWIEYKRDKEVNLLRQRPHPLEFSLYFDV
jgi:glutamine synthetase